MSIKNIGYTGVEILCDIPHAYPPSFNDNEIQSVKESYPNPVFKSLTLMHLHYMP